MRRHAYRLIDYNDIIVFVDNGHISCDRLRLGLFLRQIKFDGLPPPAMCWTAQLHV